MGQLSKYRADEVSCERKRCFFSNLSLLSLLLACRSVCVLSNRSSHFRWCLPDIIFETRHFLYVLSESSQKSCESVCSVSGLTIERDCPETLCSGTMDVPSEILPRGNVCLVRTEICRVRKHRYREERTIAKDGPLCLPRDARKSGATYTGPGVFVASHQAFRQSLLVNAIPISGVKRNGPKVTSAPP